MKKKIAVLEELYSQSSLDSQRIRYQKAIEAYKAYFCKDTQPGAFRLFSTPGRTEVGGNHTDHNHGKVLAASVNLDVIAVVEPLDVNKIVIKSEGYPENEVYLDNLDVLESETNHSNSLIRGVAKGFTKYGLKIGGFKAYTTSNVLKGSGLSSSAAFEVLIGTILSYLYNEGNISAIKLAQIAQFAENVYFGKPSGLMDQMACSVGGFVAIDFKDKDTPIVEHIDVDFAAHGHALCIIDTKGDHADLTDEYAAIPREMKAVANFFDVDCLRRISRQDILLNMPVLREKLGDRAVLRAFHFFAENERVDKLVHALKSGEFDNFLKSINDSGNSSFKYLQNIYACSDYAHQGLSLGLHIAERHLKNKGACRVHGGGFAGTIQVFVPTSELKEFRVSIERIFGAGTCHVLDIRPYGGIEVNFSTQAV